MNLEEPKNFSQFERNILKLNFLLTLSLVSKVSLHPTRPIIRLVVLLSGLLAGLCTSAGRPSENVSPFAVEKDDSIWRAINFLEKLVF